MKSTPPAKVRFLGLLPAGFLIRALCYGVLWGVLTGGRVDGWLIGVPAVLAAASIIGPSRMFRRGRFFLSGAIRFAGYFLKASLISGIDVVGRALRPQLPLQPDLIEYRLSLSTEAARIFMADTVSLLPGTLSANLVEEKLTVHVLDRKAPVMADLRVLERYVAGMLESDRPAPCILEGGEG